MDKDTSRRRQHIAMTVTFMFTVLFYFILAFSGKVTSEINFGIAAILAKIGHFTYTNYTTAPTKDTDVK